MPRKHAKWVPWLASERATLQRGYADRSTREIAQKLGRPVKEVYAQAYRMGLKKSPAYLASPDSGRLRPGERRNPAGQFQKGLTPWNTGLKGWQAGGRSVATRFKKGQLSARWDPEAYGLGALRLTTDGTLLIKYRPGAGRFTWMVMARWVWWTETGHKPRRGEVVRARNGDPHDTRMQNLELLTKAENARRNSMWTKYPHELCQLFQLRGAITRQVNRITREATP